MAGGPGAAGGGGRSAGPGRSVVRPASGGPGSPRLSLWKPRKDAGSVAREEAQYHALSVDAVVSLPEVSVSLSSGLSSSEAAARLAQRGPNELSERAVRTLWDKVYDQVANVLVMILLVVAVISIVQACTAVSVDEAVSAWIQVALIVGVIVINTRIGVYQEGQAEQSAQALKSMLSSEAVVLRDGVSKVVPARELVVGDLVQLSLGDKVPADLRLVRVRNLCVLESALTGESVAVEKRVEALLTGEGARGSGSGAFFAVGGAAAGDGAAAVGGAAAGGAAAAAPALSASSSKLVALGDRRNMCFSATLVAQGEGLGVVVATGDESEIGKINGLVNQLPRKQSNVQVQLDLVSKWIGIFVIGTAVVVVLIGFFYAGQKALEAVTFGLVCAVAMIPAGLPAIMTMAYSYAVAKMARQNAIVRVLPAVETLGSVTVICSDKTGTLTMNLMSLVGFVASEARYAVDATAEGRSPATWTDAASGAVPPDAAALVRSALCTGVLCSHAELGRDGGREGELGNPTEVAMLRAFYRAGLDPAALRAAQPLVTELPFSSEYKFMATVHVKAQAPGQAQPALCQELHVKGAVDRLLPLCVDQLARCAATSPGTDTTAQPQRKPLAHEYWTQQAEQMAAQGLRVLALARAELGPEQAVAADAALDAAWVRARPLTMVGLCCILDPPRRECVEAIKVAHRAGVRVAMITGDHKATALAIGEMLGIVDRAHASALTGPELDAMDDEELRVAVMRHNVFARASPENKIRIVQALQREGQVASMTGDGVNDAPALRAADMGVAMGKEGTDVAREAAEMILTDDNFATIVAAIREGRAVWDNLRKVLLFNQPVNNAQGMTVLFGLILGMPYSPLTPVQVLYCNLICAVSMGVVLAIEEPEADVMLQPPRRPGKRLVGRYLLFRLAYTTLVLVIATLGAVSILRAQGVDADLWPPELQPVTYGAGAGSSGTPGACTYPMLFATGADGTWYSATSGNYSTADNATAYCCPNRPEPERHDRLVCPNTKGRGVVRSIASNTLTLCAVSVMLSARFAYQSSLHPRVFRGNKYVWATAALTLLLQVAITYIPTLNDVVFAMQPMTPVQWAIVAAFTVATLLVLEAEKMAGQARRKQDDDDESNIDSKHKGKDDDDDDESNINAAPSLTNSSRRSTFMQQLLKR